MKWIDLDELLARMTRLERAAFSDFNEVFRDLIRHWCGEFYLGRLRAERETERCLFEIPIMAVHLAHEIAPGRFKRWVRVQTRALVMGFWQSEADRTATIESSTLIMLAEKTKLTAGEIRKLTAHLDGSPRSYQHAAKRLGLPAGWLRRQHRHFVTRLRQQVKAQVRFDSPDDEA